jgi:hypothetical protein
MPGYSLQGPYGPRGKPVNIPGFSPSIPGQGQAGIQPIRAPMPQPSDGKLYAGGSPGLYRPGGKFGPGVKLPSSFGNYQGFGGGMAGVGQGMPMRPLQMPFFGGFQGFGRPAFPGLGMPYFPQMGNVSSISGGSPINLMNAGIGSMVDEMGQAPIAVTPDSSRQVSMAGAAQNQSLDRLRNMARRILGRRSGGGTPGGGGMGPSNEYSRASIF